MSDKAPSSNMPEKDNDAETPDIDIDNICSGCRCGWICCECSKGCFSCKERIKYCYCSSNIFPCMKCEICVMLLPNCQCELQHRCKWCRTSLMKCRRGGCLHQLPDRASPEAQPLVARFLAEDGPEDDEPTEGELATDNESVQSLDVIAPSSPQGTASTLSVVSSFTSCSSLSATDIRLEDFSDVNSGSSTDEEEDKDESSNSGSDSESSF